MFTYYIINTVMALQPFTPDGLDLKLKDLYALTDGLLYNEAKAAVTDFPAWLNANFTLTSEQQDYLQGAPDNAKLLWGSMAASSLVTRGPFKMPAAPFNPQPRRTKEISKKSSGTVKYDDGTKLLTGSISLEIEWKLL